MSALEGFYTTWNNARTTYGEGTPQTGEQYDNSPKLTQMATDLEGAAPGSRWTGAASEAYDKANKEHRETFTRLADLDQKLAAEVTNSANAVNAGRTNLESLRQWVQAAEASVPPGKNGDQIRMAIAQKGLAQLQEIVKQSNSESNAIGGRIGQLKAEFEALGNQRFGPKEAPGEDPLGGEDEKPKLETLPPEQRAERDVRETLQDGDQAAAGRVEQVLGGIKPYQELTPEQAAYLNEMQKQQNGMSVPDLKAAEDRLGDKGHVIGDSWQLLSNDDVPRTAGEFDRQEKGGFDRLPQSVQDAIKSPGALPADNSLRDIAAIVQDGNKDLQTGTELDRELMRKADRMMDTSLFTDNSTFNPEKKTDFIDDTVNDIFESAGRDHQIVHDHITGIHSDDGQDFLRDISTHEWNDDGKAAGSLFEWTKDTTGTERTIAAETANVYAEFLGRESGNLLAIDGNRQIGDMNPELVKAFSTGLLPYQEELVTDQPRVDTPFHRLDELTGSMDKTKGLFAVIDSQQDAAREWNKAAYNNALDLQESFAEFARNHPDMPANDARVDDLQASARMLGAIDGGMNQETLSNINNAEMSREQANEAAKAAHDFKKDILRSVFSYGRGGDLVTNTFADVLAGPPPEIRDVKIHDTTGMITDVGLSSSEQSIGYQNTQAQYAVASQFVHAGNPHVDARFFGDDGKLLPPSQIHPTDWSIYDAQLTTSMAEYTHISPMLQKFNITLGQVGGSEG